MDLFSYADSPLSLSPESHIRKQPTGGSQLSNVDFEDFVGQRHLFGSHGAIARILNGQPLGHLVFWGPSGCGKTTLARLLVGKLNREMIEVHGIDFSSKEVKQLAETLRVKRRVSGVASVIFVDEIHRLTRVQQDVLLPFLEQGDFILIGATTESPRAILTSALTSRLTVLELKPLGLEDLKSLVVKSFNKSQLNLAAVLEPSVLQALIESSGGDARVLLRSTESIVNWMKMEGHEGFLGLEILRDLIELKTTSFNSDTDRSDLVSALIKSMRRGDADASIFYLVACLSKGEDPLFISRRLIIFASEDVGNSDPRAISMSVAIHQGVKDVGMPEAEILLAQGVIFLALTHKSNKSYLALRNCQKRIKSLFSWTVPGFLKRIPQALGTPRAAQTALNSNSSGSGFCSCLPIELKNEIFYEPSDIGFEKYLRESLERFKAQI